jgi:zinc protease
MSLSVFRRITRDGTSLLLFLALLGLAGFVAWQALDLDDRAQARLAVTPSVAGLRPVQETLDAVARQPVARPKLALERWRTDEGAVVLFVPAPELPMLDIRLVFDGGSARDDAQSGLARFTSAMLDEGTGTRDVDEISSGFESVGASFSAASYRDMAVVELRTLTRPEFLDKSLDLFTDVVANAAFPADAMDRIREQMLIGLKRDDEDPGTIAGRSFMAALYLAHPYAAPPDGTAQAVARITREDLIGFHRRFYTGGNLVVAITGAIDTDRAKRIAARISNALPRGPHAPPLAKSPEPAGGSFHVEYASSQTHIYLGLPAIRRNDPDQAALMVANEILGGSGLNSLLGEAVRNERGLAYSVGSGFSAMREAGPFSVVLQTRNEQAREALDVVQQVLRDFSEKGPDEKLVADARAQLIGRFPLQLAGNDSVVGTLGMLGFYDLPDDHLQQQLARIEVTTAAEVRDAFRRHVPLDKLAVVTLGPGKSLGGNAAAADKKAPAKP